MRNTSAHFTALAQFSNNYQIWWLFSPLINEAWPQIALRWSCGNLKEVACILDLRLWLHFFIHSFIDWAWKTASLLSHFGFEFEQKLFFLGSHIVIAVGTLVLIALSETKISGGYSLLCHCLYYIKNMHCRDKKLIAIRNNASMPC